MVTQIFGIITLYLLYVLGYYIFKAFDVKVELCAVWPLMIAVMFAYTVLVILPVEAVKAIISIFNG